MKAFFYPLLLAGALSVTSVSAQQKASEATPAPAPLTRQFNGLKNNANSYRENNQEYKVVNVKSLDAFWKSVQATIVATEQGLINGRETAEKNLEEAQATIAAQQEQITSLKQENAQKEEEVQKSMHDVNSLSVLGLDMQKQVYVLLTAGIILALLIALAVILLQYKSSRTIALKKQNDYNAIDQELNEYKKSARERELKIKRELQTELNRIEELNQEIARLKKQPQL
ncbi:hypothetical protein CLV24_11648 [Pontibacter ummariensis]|uniref:Uncharacterized protein n=1 Tax=Pontibacter ummariensis TaxID=1610492 RepID=A0A239I9I2_9BACT|nr:hypothetical protein [Pontibacter ummariensis]PRY09980.1 hypothetical protein CLV24_11648 [Pontibacter ummariensis]SNS90042.1 hypothetical protein SAMN06296052_11651 [Pontibacter ummariensis]